MKRNIIAQLWQLVNLIIVVSLLNSLIVGCGSQSEKKLEKVKMAMPVAVMPFLTYYVALEQGYFADEGYAPELIITGGSGPDVQALLAGEVDFALTGLGNILPAYDKGQGVIAVQNMYGVMAFDLIIHKKVAEKLGITEDTPLDAKLDALRGLTIAVTKVGSLSHILARMYVRRAGLQEGQDVDIIAAGSFPATLAALEKSEADVIFDFPPTEQRHLMNETAIRLVNNSEGEDPELADAIFEVVAIRADFADDEPDKVRSIVRAFTRANRWIADAPPEQVADVLATIVSDDFQRDELVAAAKVAKIGISPEGRLTQEGVNAIQQVLFDAGLISQIYPWTAIATNAYIPSDTNLK